MNTRRTLATLAALAATALALTIAGPADARPASRTIPVELPQVKDTGCRDGQPIASYYGEPTPRVTYTTTQGTFTTPTLTIDLRAPRGYDLSVAGVNVGTEYTAVLVNNTWATACGGACGTEGGA